eukprot:356731-Chlamydomonas_euryale.AAC.4
MDQCVVREPLLVLGARDAQKSLQAVVPDYEPKWCEYIPFWFQGDHSEQIIADKYDEQVMIQAPGFEKDKG